MSEKDKSVIPQSTPYCYSGSRAPNDPNYKPCPYWKWLGEGKARCDYLDIEDGEGPIDLLWDQVKDGECPSNRRRLLKKTDFKNATLTEGEYSSYIDIKPNMKKEKGCVKKTIQLTKHVNLDLDEEGELIGIEII